MRTVLKYPGSKWNIASKLVKLIPEHHSYVEPFFGSGAVLFNKPVSDIETINDLDHDVVNLFRCIQEDADRLARMVMTTPFSREKYEDTYKLDVWELMMPDEPYHKALRFLIQCWQGHGFRTNGSKVGWKNDVQGRERAYALWNWYRLPEWIIDIAERLRMVQIENRPALNVIERFNYSNVFMYIDPPYVLGTRTGKQYKHEMSDADHEELLKLLLQSKAKIMLSGYESEMYNDYLAGWEKKQFSSCAEYGKPRTETVWMNYKADLQMNFEDFPGGDAMINGELIVDNFAGGGGASTGIELATGYSVDIAINHDPEAIKMHKANHPNTKHYCENVWAVDPVKACKGHPVALAWFSPDCKHFSKAKGGKPKDKNIRGLAWVACRWAGLVRPRVIMLENVEEFKTWGPLNRGHHPIKSKQGKTFERFVQQLTDLGYKVEFRELVAADYGAPTMRKRFFMIARCDGKPIVWPEPTHGPADSEAVKAGLLKPYVGAYTQIDFTRPCPSIFDTSEEIKDKYGIRAVRPLAKKTMDRIARGLKKFVLDNPEPFIIQCNHGGERRPNDIREPMPTITGKHGYGIVEPYMVQIGQTGFTKDRSKDVREPLTTIVSKNEHCLISPTLIQYHSETAHGEVRGQTIKDPIMTVDGSNRYGLVTSFLSKFYKSGIGQDMREPLHTITTSAGHFGEVRAFLIKYYGQGTGQDIKAPLDTVTAQDRFGLVTIEGIDYQIVDIGLRMLEPKELYGCQGFPDDYIIDHDYTGKTYPRSEQVKRCGNAVCPPIPAALVKANLPELCVAKRTGNMRIAQEQTGQLRFA